MNRPRDSQLRVFARFCVINRPRDSQLRIMGPKRVMNCLCRSDKKTKNLYSDSDGIARNIFNSLETYLFSRDTTVFFHWVLDLAAYSDMFAP